MKQQADQHRTDREFQIGDWVFLKLHPYRQQSLIRRPSHKLSPRFYGPFQILARVGSVAYKLQLPLTSKIHPVFHVSLLKKKVGDAPAALSTLPPIDKQGVLQWLPEQILQRSCVRKRNKPVTQWLIKWSGLPNEDATWEDAHNIAQRFPHFQP